MAAHHILSARELEARYKAAANEATQRKTRIKINDGGNLMLIVRPGGGASWVLNTRVGGVRKPYTLGPWPTMTLKRAREAAQATAEVMLDGVDPAAKRRQERAGAASGTTAGGTAPGGTVLELFNDWLRKKRTSAVYRGNITAAMEKDVLPHIGAKPVEQVTRADIVAILRRLEERGALVMLRRVRMYLHQMFEFALDEEPPRIQAMPVPTGHLKSFMAPEPGHYPALTDVDEVPGLMRAIRAYERTIVRACLLMAAHTFQRPTEVRSATWDQFDLDAARWVIPEGRMKKRREHWVPLSPQVVAMLRAHQGVVGTVGWLFPGIRRDQPISEGTMNGALEKMGYKGRHSPHGFRAMAHTILAEHLRVDERFIEKQLSHEEKNKVKRAYNRAEFWDQRVEMMAAWSTWLDSQT